MTDLRTRDQNVSWHPYTQHGVDNEPLPVVGASGSRLHLADGRELIDGISSWWSILHGHGAPELVEALHQQARTLDHVLFAGTTHEPAVRLAERLVSAAGPMTADKPLARVFYSDNGSTAVEVAMKMAYHTHAHAGEDQRTVFLALEGSYHGDTFGAMAIGDPVPFFEPYAPFLFEVVRVPPTADAMAKAIGEIGERLCAVVLEPLVQGAAGMIMYGPDVLHAARSGCDETGGLLIADEVMTGFGRTGALFACEKAGVRPDLLCLAKGITGGMTPLAATLATEGMFESFLHDERTRFFPHGHTWTAHPIGCAVGLASLDLCERNNVPARLDAIGQRIEAGLVELEDDPRVSELRRTGGIVALELTPPEGDFSGYLANIVTRLRRRSIEEGVLLRPLGNVLYALPPACVTDDECDMISGTMARLVREL